MTRFDQALDRALQFREARREAPAADWRSAWVFVLIPLGAGVVALVSWLLLAWGLHWPARLALIVGGGCMFLTLCYMLVMIWSKPLLYSREVIDWGWKPSEPTERQTVKLEVETMDHQELRFMELPIADEGTLYHFAARLLEGYPLSESEWTGRGKPFSKRQFHTVRDQMIVGQVARWRDAENPSQGLELTPYGRSVMRGIVAQYAGTAQDEPPLLGEADDST